MTDTTSEPIALISERTGALRALRASVPTWRSQIDTDRQASLTLLDQITAVYLAGLAFAELQRERQSIRLATDRRRVHANSAIFESRFNETLLPLESKGMPLPNRSAMTTAGQSLQQSNPVLAQLLASPDNALRILDGDLQSIENRIRSVPHVKSSWFGRGIRRKQLATHTQHAVEAGACGQLATKKLLEELDTYDRENQSEWESEQALRSLVADAEESRRHVNQLAQRHIADLNSHVDREACALARHWQQADTVISQRYPTWEDPRWERWQAPSEAEVRPHIRLGTLEFREGTHHASLSLLWPFPAKQSLLLLANAASKTAVRSSLTSIALRALTCVPPGRMRLRFIDPVMRAATFAPFFTLQSTAPELIGERTACDAEDISRVLKELDDQVARVQQDYLRGQYDDLEAYNRAVGEIAEPYYVLFVADAPHGLSHTSAERLANLYESGPACGVYVVTMVDVDEAVPHGSGLTRITATAMTVDCARNTGVRPNKHFKDLSGAPVRLEPAPSARTTDGPFAAILKRIALEAPAARKVVVPFDRMFETAAKAGIIDRRFQLQQPSTWWSANSANGLSVPVGRTGATDLQLLRFDDSTAHALIIGRVGSGKTRFAYVMLSGLCLQYSPDELEVTILDYKEGADYALYSNPSAPLPHLATTGINTDREFGLAVLQRLESERQRRQALFTALSVDATQNTEITNIAQYRAVTGQSLPRHVLLIDEFQVLVAQQDKIGLEAVGALEQLVRLGRSAGMHVVLATQTLAGLSHLNGLFGQFAAKIAFMCEAADASRLFGDNNTEPRTLERPGEAIYNANQGNKDSNRRFQTALLGTNNDGAAEQVAAGIAQRGPRSRPSSVYDGSRLPTLREHAQRLAGSTQPTLLFGDSPSLFPPIEVSLSRRNAQNLVVLGGMASFRYNAALVAAQCVLIGQSSAAVSAIDFGEGQQWSEPPLQPTDPERFRYSHAARLELPSSLIPTFDRVPRLTSVDPAEVAELLRQAVESIPERRERAKHGEVAPWFIVLHEVDLAPELQKKPGYRDPDPREPNALLSKLLNEGGAARIHLLLSASHLVGLQRVIERDALAASVNYRISFGLGSSDNHAFLGQDPAGAVRPGRGFLVDQQRSIGSAFRPCIGLPIPSRTSTP
jgi:DNA segregation ATPase FtsK/SpoIIIE, S-DNA-T family